MSRPVAVTQREARSYLRAAEAEHGVIEVKVGNKVVRFIPQSLAQLPQPIDEERDFRL